MNTRTILSGRILLVGSPDASAPVAEILEDGSWTCIRAHSPGEALGCLRHESAIDVVVIAPGRGIRPYAEMCRQIKFRQQNTFVSVVFILAAEFAEHRTQVFEAGADDCIQLPAPRNEVLLRLLNAVRATRATDSLEDATAVITALANAIEGKDTYTCGHVERVATYSMEISKRIGVDQETLSALKTGALLHDIGKVAVPDHILNKPGKLTEAEMNIVKRHPIIGYDIVKPLHTFKNVLPIIRWHHERLNGTGYPDGLKDEDLPLLPRIVAIADCFDAMSTDRPYRPALALGECIDILSRGADNGDLDSELIDKFFEVIEEGTTGLVGARR